MPLDAIRSVLKDGNPAVRSIWFTPSATGEIVLAVEASGLTDDVTLDLTASSTGSISNGRLRTGVTAGQRTQIDVTLSEPFDGPIELSAVRFTEAAAEAVA